MPKTVSIIGAGEIGAALGQLIRQSGADVELWDKDPARVPNQKPLAEVVPKADVVIFCIPSLAMRPAIGAMTSHLRPETVVVSLAKGLEQPGGQTMAEVMAEALPSGQPCALLGGPMLAEELTLGLPGAAVVAAKKRETFERVRDLFAGAPRIRVEWSDDLRLTALLGVLKNVYAVGLGIADGLGWGMNAKGWFTALALREMDAVVAELHGATGAANGTAGLGDYVATGFSPYSRNRESGHKIVEGGNCDKKSEGCLSLPPLVEKLGDRLPRFPIIRTLHTIIYEKADAKDAFEGLIREA